MKTARFAYWEKLIELTQKDLDKMECLIEKLADDEELTNDEYCKLYDIAIAQFQTTL